MDKTYLFIYKYKDNQLQNTAYISLEQWDDILPISDWIECTENKNKELIIYYPDIEFNLVLEQFGNDNILISKKAFWTKEDPEKIQLKDICIRFDDTYNLTYYNELIRKINKDQKCYNKTFNIKNN